MSGWINDEVGDLFRGIAVDVECCGGGEGEVVFYGAVDAGEHLAGEHEEVGDRLHEETSVLMNRKLRVILLAGFVGFLLIGGVRTAYNLFMLEVNPVLGIAVSILLLGLLNGVVVIVRRRMERSEPAFPFTPEDWFWVAVTGWVLAAVCTSFSGSYSTFDLQLHDTYFVIAHIHLFAGLAVFFGAFGLFYHYNRWMGTVLGMIHFWMTFLASLVCIWPYRGLAGMPRRYIDYSSWVYLDGFGGYNDVEIGLVLLGVVAQVVFLVNVVYSMVGGRKSVD